MSKVNKWSQKDLQILMELVEILDSYRVHRYVDIRPVNEAIKKGKLKKEIASKWEKIQPTLVKMASVTASIPGVIKLVKIRDLINFLSLIFLTSAFALIAMRLLFRSVPNPGFEFWEELIFPNTLALMFIALIAKVIINRKIGFKIENFYREKGSRELDSNDIRLKECIQDFINILSNQVKRIHFEPEKCIMQVYKIDYRKIRVIEEPSRFRKYYTVTIE